MSRSKIDSNTFTFYFILFLIIFYHWATKFQWFSFTIPIKYIHMMTRMLTHKNKYESVNSSHRLQWLRSISASLINKINNSTRIWTTKRKEKKEWLQNFKLIAWNACMVGFGNKIETVFLKNLVFYVFRSFWCVDIKNNFLKIKKILFWCISKQKTL
jgi:hypothetical protein